MTFILLQILLWVIEIPLASWETTKTATNILLRENIYIYKEKISFILKENQWKFLSWKEMKLFTKVKLKFVRSFIIIIILKHYLSGQCHLTK